MYINHYIAHETERQSGTMSEAAGMARAWQYMYDSRFDELTEDDLITCVYLINDITGYRNTPVFFRNGGHAVNHLSIPRAMEALVSAINEPGIFTERRINPGVTVTDITPDTITKEFLDIHPFADGNGRVASLLWNRLNKTLNCPNPMPYFFGTE